MRTSPMKEAANSGRLRKLLTAGLALTALALPAASAQTVTVNITANVPFPTALATAADLLSLLARGATVTFMTSTAQPAATLGTSGIVVSPRVPTQQPITQVQVMTPIPGTTQAVREIYPLAQPLTAERLRTVQPLSVQGQASRPPSGTLQVQSIQVTDKQGRRHTLGSVVGRQAAWAKAPGLQKKPGQMPPGQYKKLNGDKAKDKGKDKKDR